MRAGEGWVSDWWERGLSYGEDEVESDEHLPPQKGGDHQESVETDDEEILWQSPDYG